MNQVSQGRKGSDGGLASRSDDSAVGSDHRKAAVVEVLRARNIADERGELATAILTAIDQAEHAPTTREAQQLLEAARRAWSEVHIALPSPRVD